MKQTAETLYDLKFVSEPIVSSDGRFVACVVSQVTENKKGYTSQIYLSRDGQEVQPFTSGQHIDSSPRFSNDGLQMVFVRVVDDQSQLFILPVHGGEARQLTKLKSGISSPQFSVDGTRVAFLSRGDWVDIALIEGLPREIEHLRYKEDGVAGAGLCATEPKALWVLDLTSGKLERVSKHPTEIGSFAWLPTGWGLVFTASQNQTSNDKLASEVFLLMLGQKKPQRLTNWHGSLGHIAVSPNGLHFAVLANPDLFGQPGDSHLYYAKLERNTKLQPVAAEADLRVGNSLYADSQLGAYPITPFWRSDDTILCLIEKSGSCRIYEFSIHKDSAKALIEPQGSSISAFSATTDGRVAYLLEHPAHPCELYFVSRQLSNFNNSSPNHDLEHIVFQRDHFTIEGWVLKPTNLKRNKKCPVVLYVHGGPAWAWGYTHMHEFQVLASAGYAVAFCNIRGSTGYGDAQTAGIQGDYLNEDYQDLLAFFDACLEQFPYLDQNRTAIIGSSYGGLMTNWTISHTKRFKAAIADCSLCNWISLTGTSDIGYRFVPRELRGTFPEDWEHLWEKSPLKHVKNVSTPCLILHSEEDHRCPIEQAEQWYVALKKVGVPTKLIRVPGENHELSSSGRPDRRVYRLNAFLQWLEEHLQAPKFR